MEAVILAGGFGTRLRSVVGDVPKPMADIGGKPFLEHLLTYIIQQGVTHLILCVHHMRDIIVSHFGATFQGCVISYAIEEQPLGTGGALINALSYVRGNRFFVLNGDSFLQLDYRHFADSCQKAPASLVLRQVPDASRYGRVEINATHIVAFQEKGRLGQGLINGGVYLVEKDWLVAQNMPLVFSIEQEVFLLQAAQGTLGYFVADGYFIDIGIPEDYQRAIKELPSIIKMQTSSVLQAT
jgi:D-glycero-alpha-D-manno-heptose 1-phosphate guanylyltransferase